MYIRHNMIFFYRQEKNSKEKVEQKSKGNKYVLPPTPRRSKHINDATNVAAGNNSGDADVKTDNAHGDVQEDIADGDVQHKYDLFTQSLKEIINNHDIKGKSNLEIIYSKLKQMLEPTSIETIIELTTTKSDVAKKHAVLVNASCEDNTPTFVVLQNKLIAPTDGTGSARNIASGSEDVSAFVKRQRLSQGL
jgi:hypothetical protein